MTDGKRISGVLTSTVEVVLARDSPAHRVAILAGLRGKQSRGERLSAYERKLLARLIREGVG